MVNLCVFILGILSVIYAIPSNNQVCLTVIPIKNYILIRQRYKVLYEKNFGSCTYACELNSVCHSTNYYFKTRMCELNKSPADGWQKRSLVAHESAVFTLNPHKISCQHAGCVDGVCSSQIPGQVQEMFTCSCQHLIQSGKSCQGRAIGMESGEIPPSSISSSSFKPGYEGFKGRLHHPEGWIANVADYEQYLQVSLDISVKFVAIASQGVANTHFQCWIQIYYILFATSNIYVWQPYKEDSAVKSFVGNSDSTTVHINNLQNSHLASAIRVKPTSWHQCVGMRVEFYALDG